MNNDYESESAIIVDDNKLSQAEKLLANSDLLSSSSSQINSSKKSQKLSGNKQTISHFSMSFCECMNGKDSITKLNLSKKQLVSPDYQKIGDIMKMVKFKKEKISKTSYYDDPIKLKECYVKMCKNFSCYASILFIVREIVSTPTADPPKVTIKKVKRILAIKSNKISLVDYKTKQLIRSQRISDVKSWCTGNSSPINLSCGPDFLMNNQNRCSENVTVMKKNENSIADTFIATNEQLTMNSIDGQKLFLIEFRSTKWQLYIDDQSTLKSITCLLLDQSLDLGIDNNPLMLDLTIAGNIHNHKKSISQKHTNFHFLRSKTNRSLNEKSISRNNEKLALNVIPVGNSVSGLLDEISSDYMSAVDLNTNTNASIAEQASIKEKSKHMYRSNNTIWINKYQYSKEFEQLQSIIFWFPEEAAYRLTEVEYELFKSVKPIEYLRHVALDAGNLTNLKSNNDSKHRTVQDLIIRYKEVSSWIKKLIQFQESQEKRLAITLSCIRCAITCWNIGNFNSAREIWLGLK